MSTNTMTALRTAIKSENESDVFDCAIRHARAVNPDLCGESLLDRAINLIVCETRSIAYSDALYYRACDELGISY
jgi:hypothetical protein